MRNTTATGAPTALNLVSDVQSLLTGDTRIGLKRRDWWDLDARSDAAGYVIGGRSGCACESLLADCEIPLFVARFHTEGNITQ